MTVSVRDGLADGEREREREREREIERGGREREDDRDMWCEVMHTVPLGGVTKSFVIFNIVTLLLP